VVGNVTGKTKRLPRNVREQQMLDAAVQMFARRGYHAASMDEVAELAGVSKPMVYLYLGSKEELFLACIRREAGRLLAAFAGQVDPGEGPDQQLWHALRAFFLLVAENRDAWRVLHQQAPAYGEPFAGEVAAMRAAIVAYAADLIDKNIKARGPAHATAQDVSALAHALVGAGESLADWATEHPEEDPATTAKRLMNFAWLGLDNLLRGSIWRP
jgi:AcrR family transcriptional regulator